MYRTWQLTEIYGTNERFHGRCEFISVLIDIPMKSSKYGVIFRNWASTLIALPFTERKGNVPLYLVSISWFHHDSIVDRAFL